MRPKTRLLALIILAGCCRAQSGPPLVEPLLQQAEELARQRNYAGALQAYQRAAALAPGDARILHQVSHCHYMLEQYEQAIETGLRSVAIQETPVGRSNLALAYHFTGNYREAIRQSRRSIEIEPWQWQAYDAAAASCYRLGWYEEMLRSAQMGLQRAQNQPEALQSLNFWLPRAQMAKGLYAEASAVLGPGNQLVGITFRPGPRGVAAREILKGGPADLSGVQDGDIVAALAGERLHTLEDIPPVMKSITATTVPVTLHRNGVTVETALLIGVTPDLPARAARLRAAAAPPAPPARHAGSLRISRMELSPAAVAPGAVLGLEVEFSASSGAASAASVPVRFSYSITEAGKTVFELPAIAIDAPNGRPMLRRELLQAARKAGRYTVTVHLRCRESDLEESVDLTVQ